ncbi:MAG: ATP-binding protein, partial [Bifidobacterium mongoliense]|nr:ATP-binding protein [Bifidobacterium mongoliense]
RFSRQQWTCNARANGGWLREHTSPKALALINHALERHRLSLRGADRAMRLAWTLADLAGRNSPGVEEMTQGISLRTRAS